MQIEANNKVILADNIRSHGKCMILIIMKWIIQTYETDIQNMWKSLLMFYI